MTTASEVRRVSILFAILAMIVSPSMAFAAHAPIPAQAPATVQHFATAAQAVTRVLATPAQVVAFGEYHQTSETMAIPSSLARFTVEILPVLAKRTTDLVVETWVADGHCGKPENDVVEDVQTTTERPPETENEIVALLKRARAAGIAPHILTMSCKDYRRVTDKQGKTDFSKMLALTRERVQGEVMRWLGAPPAASDRPRKIAIYGGALHNDLYPAPGDRPFAFGRALFAKVKGRYLEVDLFVPEYILSDARMARKPWFESFKKGITAGDALLIRRGERSYVVVFPLTRPSVCCAPAAPPK